MILNFRISFRHIGILSLLLFVCSVHVEAQPQSLQDIARKTQLPSNTKIYLAKKIITLDENQPLATAVAVADGKILAAGSLAEVTAAIDSSDVEVDKSFKDQVVVPGFIAQHDHPLLTALTMTAEIIAIEEWRLPEKTIPAAENREDYLSRLIKAESELLPLDAPLLTWGFHHYFFGKLTRADLDKISDTRPIIVWHRSCHEFILNSAALNQLGIDGEFISSFPESAKRQSNLDEGHFWEQGMFSVIGKIAPLLATPERLNQGLELVVDYFHAKGVTRGCEPGGILSKQLQDAQNNVLSSTDNPFRFYFIPDGKSIIAAYPGAVVEETQKILSWGRGMTAMVPGQVKLFADGAIYSQLMQLKDGYLDGHEGEWMMDLQVFENAFRQYWDAGYQIHIHVNGDAGLDMVLKNLEDCMKRNSREDHRTVIVHFAVSNLQQVNKIAELGAIVSANPYYPIALADKYGEEGLGPERADPMTRMGDVERAGVSFSFHSDMPMAPADPLFLMHCAVNRKTFSGRIAAPQQRVSRLAALKAVTLGAAYSLQMEDEIGSVAPGKLANFTILEDDPVACSPDKIKDIEVWGTVHEGELFPVKTADSKNSAALNSKDRQLGRVRRLNEIQLRRLAGKQTGLNIWTSQQTTASSTNPKSSGNCYCGNSLLRVLVESMQEN